MGKMQWSDAARAPREVAAAVDSRGELRLERRGAMSFVLMREDRASEAKQGMASAARMLRNILNHQGHEVIVQALSDTASWIRFLPEKDRREFSSEFVETLEACSELDMWAPLGRLVHEWAETAKIHADPALAASLSRAVDADLGPVPAPATPSAEEDDAEEG